MEQTMSESVIQHLIHQGMNPDLMQRLAGSLLHFVWQGAVIAMVSAVILRLLSNRSAEWRYTVSVAALFLMLAAPIVTFMFYMQTGRITLLILQWITDSVQGSAQPAAQAATTATWTQWIVLFWFTGVLICSVRLIAGWRMSLSLIKVGTSGAPSNIQHTFHEIKGRLAMTRPVRLLVSLRIDTPVAIGWLRPAILLPVTALTGLNELQLRAVLCHELAHIRRHDFLVNLVQRGVESILFYHPGVWWISARIRAEREHCCDDLAIQISGNPSMYAEALMELERVRTADPEPALAATGGILTQRIHRLLGYRVVNSDLQSAIAALTFVVVWVIVGAWQFDGTLIAKSKTPLSAPSQIVVNSEIRTPGSTIKAELAPSPAPEQTVVNSEDTLGGVAGAVHAIAAIATAQTVTVQSPPIPPNPAAAKTGTLMLFVSVQMEGGGRIPIFANGRFPKLRLTKLDTNIPYEMPFSNVVINVPVNFEYGAVPDEYRVSVEDLPDGYAVKKIMYPADESGLRFVDVSTQTLRISSRAIYSRGAGSTKTVGAPDLPIAITLTRTTAPAPSGIRVSGTSDGLFVMPQIPVVGGSLTSTDDPDTRVNISGKPGILYDNGTFEFFGVSPGPHSITLISAKGGTAQKIAAAEVIVRDRNVEGVPLQVVPVLPNNNSSPQKLPLTVPAASVLPLPAMTVRALDDTTHQPIASGHITLSGVGSPTQIYIGTSNPIGKIPRLLPGEYLLTADGFGYQSKTQTITVGFEDTSFDITLSRAPGK